MHFILFAERDPCTRSTIYKLTFIAGHRESDTPTMSSRWRATSETEND